MSDTNDVQTYTVRLELVDRPGELLSALEPIADRGGNLLSIFHERGNRTPRGHVPVEVDLEATPAQFEAIVDALRETDIDIVQAGQDRYGEAFVVVLFGEGVEAGLSETLSRVQPASGASVRAVSLTCPDGETPSARLRLAAESGAVADTIDTLRAIAADRNLRVIEPLAPGGDT